jgi:magnesium and cobalt exporter, CNNM family
MFGRILPSRESEFSVPTGRFVGVLSDPMDQGPDAANSFVTMELLIGIVGLTLAVSFFCSICEAALYAVSHAHIEKLASSGHRAGLRLQRLRRDVDQPIAAILTLNTVANTVGATLAGSLAAALFDSLGVGIFSALFTLGILYISEIIPKTLGVIYADRLAPRLAGPIEILIVVLWPFVQSCRFLTRLFPRAPGTAGASEEDLLALARLGLRVGAIRPDEARWMQNALNLDRFKVGDILTPRTVVFSVPKEMTIADAAQAAIGWRQSRVPVTDEGDLDEIAGVVLRTEILDAAAAGRGAQTLAQVMRPPIFVPEAMKVSDLLTKFLREKQHLFIVADEYGGTAGIVTLEDSVETLLGAEIIDESDRDADLQHLARKQASERLHLNESKRDK